jgi:hypothetical protein
MAPYAERLRSLFRHDRFTTQDVDAVGDRLQVLGPHAGGIAAQMVEL